MKKKISLMIGMCLLILGLTACGQADPSKVDYNGYSYEQLQSTCQNMAMALSSLEKGQIEQYKQSAGEGNEMLVNLLTRWEAAIEGNGDYRELGEFTITKSGKTLTCAQEIIYEKRPVILTYVYKYYNMELEDITVDAVLTMGEKMTNAALNTLMGMGTVFTVLILISLIIYCFRYVNAAEQKMKVKSVPAEVPEAAPALQQEEAVEVQDDLELVAVIAAAIAASTGTSADDFVVRSIKRRF